MKAQGLIILALTTTGTAHPRDEEHTPELSYGIDNRPSHGYRYGLSVEGLRPSLAGIPKELR